VFEQQWRRMAAAGQPHHEPVVTLGGGAEHHRAEAGCLGDGVIIASLAKLLVAAEAMGQEQRRSVGVAHASDVIAGGDIHRFIVAYAGSKPVVDRSCGTIVANMLVWQAFSHAV
jgi:hypothetical protein